MTLPPINLDFPAHLEQRGGSVDLVRDEYLHVITEAITSHPRSLQKEIGPSEVAHPCARRIGYKLLGAPDLNPFPGIPWLPTIGTAVHAWEEEKFTAANSGHDHIRWLTEVRVCVGHIGGQPCTGSLDLYDRVTATIIDHKIVGQSTLTKVKRHGPGEQYEGQIDMYGVGLAARGLPVDNVMIAFLPRNGELHNAVFWHKKHDPLNAAQALQRANGIHLAVTLGGAAALANLDTADAFCSRCPFYRQGSTDLTQGCPGDPAAQVQASPPVMAFVGAPV